jgi:hypothetical protein
MYRFCTLSVGVIYLSFFSLAFSRVHPFFMSTFFLCLISSFRCGSTSLRFLRTLTRVLTSRFHPALLLARWGKVRFTYAFVARICRYASSILIVMFSVFVCRQGKSRITCVEVAGRRTFETLTLFWRGERKRRFATHQGIPFHISFCILFAVVWPSRVTEI